MNTKLTHPVNGGTVAASPCVNICRMEGDFCCGCRRTRVEIAEWSRMSETERHRVLQLVARRRAVFSRNAKPA